MPLFKHYKQFEALTEEEVNVGKRAVAAERRAKELARVEPLDLARTTWPEYPPPVIVNAITYAARRGLHRYIDRHATELRAALAHRHDVPAERLVVGDGAAQLLTAAAQALIEPGDELVTPWPSYALYPLMARRARGHAVPVPGFSRRRPALRGQRAHPRRRPGQPERPDGRAARRRGAAPAAGRAARAGRGAARRGAARLRRRRGA